MSGLTVALWAACCSARPDPQPAGKEISVLGAAGDRGKPFLISAIPQSELLGRYRLLGNVGIAAAITGTLMLGLLIAGR